MTIMLLMKSFVAINVISRMLEECFAMNMQYIVGYCTSYVLFRSKIVTPLSESCHMNLVVIEGVCVLPPWVYLTILSIFMRLSITRGIIHAGIFVTVSYAESHGALHIIGCQMNRSL